MLAGFGHLASCGASDAIVTGYNRSPMNCPIIIKKIDPDKFITAEKIPQ